MVERGSCFINGKAVNARTLCEIVIILTSYSGSFLIRHVLDSKENVKLSLLTLGRPVGGVEV